MSKEDNIIRLDAAQLREHRDRKITESVEDTPNGLLDAETDRTCGAGLKEQPNELWRCLTPCQTFKHWRMLIENIKKRELRPPIDMAKSYSHT